MLLVRKPVSFFFLFYEEFDDVTRDGALRSSLFRFARNKFSLYANVVQTATQLTFIEALIRSTGDHEYEAR